MSFSAYINRQKKQEGRSGCFFLSKGGVFTDNEKNTGQSSILGLNENTAAAAVGAAALAVSFIPYASYFAWVVPAAAVIADKKSGFVRLCAAQIMLCSLMICAASLLTLIITPYAEAAMSAADMNRLAFLGAAGTAMSLLRVAFLVISLLTTCNAFAKKVFQVPAVTLLAKKLAKYSED